MSETHNGWKNRETWNFNAVWANDEPLYRAVVAYARTLHAERMTDQTLGLNVKNRVRAWEYGGGWGFADGGNFPALRNIPREDYPHVNEEEVGQAVREALEAES